MHVLFVSSGNNKNGISSTVYNQGESIKNEVVQVTYFTIKGKGFWGYLQNLSKLRKSIKSNKYNLIHAHYSLSAFLVSLVFPGIPIIVSLMGSDTKMNIFWKILIRLNNSLFWEQVIVKSKSMKNYLKLKNAIVIPNGVDLKMFKPIASADCKERLGWDHNSLHILFMANPSRPEKNFRLAEKAIQCLKTDLKYRLHTLNNIPHDQVVYYYNAADVCLMTSTWEGSPNVIKEAMACNAPIVSTAIGDVEWLFNGVKGCYLADHTTLSVTDRLQESFNFLQSDTSTNGRKRLLALGLDSESIARRIITIYKEILNN